MFEQFVDDDQGYLTWLDQHSQGYVVNAERTPRPSYLVLHEAQCKSISKLYGTAQYWTRHYIKICADDRTELERWAKQTVGGELQPCGRCKP